MVMLKNLRQILKQAGMSQIGLARVSGIPVSTIANYIHGRGSPKLSIAIRIAQILNTSIDNLVADNKARPEHGETNNDDRASTYNYTGDLSSHRWCRDIRYDAQYSSREQSAN